MTALTVRLPNSVHQKVRELAEHEEISVNQFIARAVSEKMASVLTIDYLKAESAKGNRSDFDYFLSMVPNNAPLAADELPSLKLLHQKTYKPSTQIVQMTCKDHYFLAYSSTGLSLGVAQAALVKSVAGKPTRVFLGGMG
jgi:hypothetical protein